MWCKGRSRPREKKCFSRKRKGRKEDNKLWCKDNPGQEKRNVYEGEEKEGKRERQTVVSRTRRKDMFVKEKKKEIEGGVQAAVVLGTIQAKRKEMFMKEKKEEVKEEEKL